MVIRPQAISELVYALLGLVVNGASLVKAAKEDEPTNFVRCIKWLAWNGLFASLEYLVFVFPSHVSITYNNGFFVYAYSYFLYAIANILYTLFLFTVIVMCFDRVANTSKINIFKTHLILIFILTVANIPKFFDHRPRCFVDDYGSYNYDYGHNDTSSNSNKTVVTETCYSYHESNPVSDTLNHVYILVMHAVPTLILLVLYVKFLVKGSNKVYGPPEGSSRHWEFNVFSVMGAIVLISYTDNLIIYLFKEVLNWNNRDYYFFSVYPQLRAMGYSYIVALTPYIILCGR